MTSRQAIGQAHDTEAGTYEPAMVRAWARSQAITVPSRGRYLPAAVVQAWRDAGSPTRICRQPWRDDEQTRYTACREHGGHLARLPYADALDIALDCPDCTVTHRPYHSPIPAPAAEPEVSPVPVDRAGRRLGMAVLRCALDLKLGLELRRTNLAEDSVTTTLAALTSAVDYLTQPNRQEKP